MLLSPKLFCFITVNNHGYVSLRLVCVKARGTLCLLSDAFAPSLLFVTRWNSLLLLVHGHVKDLLSLLF